MPPLSSYSHRKNRSFYLIHFTGINKLPMIAVMQVRETGLPATLVTFLGMACLAAAMGIGRFAFTPLLPLMQQHAGTSIAQGAWLAAANYIGYLVGALVCVRVGPSPGRSMGVGLFVVGASTAVMAMGEGLAPWLLLRLVAGVASAFVMVGASSWALAALAAAGRADQSGWVFGGVGIGIVVAGLVALITASLGQPPAMAWLALGGCAFLVFLGGWSFWSRADPPSVNPAAAGVSRFGMAEWALIVCYGSFGFGYIIPATFIPAIARSLIHDPIVFGWAWPLFGATATASTVLVTRYLGAVPPRTVAVWSLVVMAAGVIAPALAPNLVTVVISALCVGGTFMVMTMAGIQEARRLSAVTPGRLIAAMTAAFAVGQLAGPVLVGLGSATRDAILAQSVAATLLLLLSAATLAFGPGRTSGK